MDRLDLATSCVKRKMHETPFKALDAFSSVLISTIITDNSKFSS